MISSKRPIPKLLHRQPNLGFLRERHVQPQLRFPLARKDFRPLQGHILVVDDDPSFLKMIEWVLRNMGLHVTGCSQPTAVEHMLRQTQPDILLLDVCMTERNGYAICQSIRIHEQWRNLPVLFLSGATDSQHRIEAFRADGDDFISKPVVPEELYTRLRARIDRQRQQRYWQHYLLALQQEHSQLLAVLNQLPVGSLILDPEHTIIFASDSCQQYLGKPVQKILHQRFDDLQLFNKNTYQAINHDLQSPRHEHNPIACTIAAKSDGKTRHFDLQVHEGPGPNQHILYFHNLTQVRDIQQSPPKGCVCSAEATM